MLGASRGYVKVGGSMEEMTLLTLISTKNGMLPSLIFAGLLVLCQIAKSASRSYHSTTEYTLDMVEIQPLSLNMSVGKVSKGLILTNIHSSTQTFILKNSLNYQAVMLLFYFCFL